MTVTTTVSPDELVPPLQLRGEHRKDLVAVELLTLAVDRQAAVRVAVEGKSRVGAVLNDRRGQHVEVRGPDARVDVRRRLARRRSR